MLHTYLTTSWHLRYPISGAPMAYVGRGRLARAVSQAGGLVTRQQPAGDVIQHLGDGAERLLRERSALPGGHKAVREEQ